MGRIRRIRWHPACADVDLILSKRPDPRAEGASLCRAVDTPIVVKPFDEVTLMTAVHAPSALEDGTDEDAG